MPRTRTVQKVVHDALQQEQKERRERQDVERGTRRAEEETHRAERGSGGEQLVIRRPSPGASRQRWE
jgi:hypothetical protein